METTSKLLGIAVKRSRERLGLRSQTQGHTLKQLPVLSDTLIVTQHWAISTFFGYNSRSHLDTETVCDFTYVGRMWSQNRM